MAVSIFRVSHTNHPLVSIYLAILVAGPMWSYLYKIIDAAFCCTSRVCDLTSFFLCLLDTSRSDKSIQALIILLLYLDNNVWLSCKGGLEMRIIDIHYLHISLYRLFASLSYIKYFSLSLFKAFHIVLFPTWHNHWSGAHKNILLVLFVWTSIKWNFARNVWALNLGL